jgi:hypothetical protein
MTDPTRRRVLTGFGGSLAALAGCSVLPAFGDETDDRPDYGREAVERAVTPVEDVLEPDVFPVGIPAALQNHHRDRAREYVDAVPVEPGYPNGEIASQVAEDRESTASALEEDASGRPRSRLETWRDRREEAAAVMGTHLAATGEIDRSDVSTLRERGRSRLASFEADWAYRASSPVDAAVVHATLEEYIQTCRSQLHTNSPFPADPGAAVFQAGDVVGTVDGAIATATDAGRLREQYRSGVDGDAGYRQHLASAASRLDRSLSRTTSDLDEYVDVEPDEAFDDNLSDTPAETLFRDASRTVEWRREQAEEARQRHDPATAVLAAGHGFVAAGALEAVVDAIEDGQYREYPTVDGIGAAVEQAIDALEAAWEATPRPLAVEVAEPALLSLRAAARRVREPQFYGGPERVFVQAVYAEAQARAVPAATALVVERLQATDSD